MAHSKPRATCRRARREPFMLMILLEALLALLLFVLIVWWTMFSGRKKGELIRDNDQE
jgi:cbb3-type cytochrome oxidase subunit 3